MRLWATCWRTCVCVCGEKGCVCGGGGVLSGAWLPQRASRHRGSPAGGAGAPARRPPRSWGWRWRGCTRGTCGAPPRTPPQRTVASFFFGEGRVRLFEAGQGACQPCSLTLPCRPPLPVRQPHSEGQRWEVPLPVCPPVRSHARVPACPRAPPARPPRPRACCRMAPLSTSAWMVSLALRRIECGSVQMKPASTSLTCGGAGGRWRRRGVCQGGSDGGAGWCAAAARPP